MKNIYKFVLIGSIVAAVCIYGLFFNRMSETAMVRWSYLWFPGLLFGAVGLKASQTSPNRPIIVAIIGVVALFLFFELIFPSL
jgi:arginine exporter protein ArgO